METTIFHEVSIVTEKKLISYYFLTQGKIEIIKLNFDCYTGESHITFFILLRFPFQVVENLMLFFNNQKQMKSH